MLCIGDLYLICDLCFDPAMERLKPSIGGSADRSGSLAEHLPGCRGVQSDYRAQHDRFGLISRKAGNHGDCGSSGEVLERGTAGVDFVG